MAVQTTYTNNGNGTIDFLMRFDDVNKVKADAALEDAAHRIYDMGLGDHGPNGDQNLWGSLSNAQKFALIGQYTQQHLLDLARDYNKYSQVRAVEQTVNAENQTKHGLD